MRPLLLAVACLVAASAARAEPPPPAGGKVAWEASFELAKAKAASEGKLLFVEFLTDG